MPLHDVRADLTWSSSAGEVTREVQVLNISGGGAAILADEALPAGLIRLSLHGASARLTGVESQAMAVSTHPSGKQLIRLRFARWVSLDPILMKNRESRLWVRYPARETRASLAWREGVSERAVRGELLNISGGGAAFASEAHAPEGIPVWLGLEASARALDPIESRLVAISTDPLGRAVSHLQFVGPCPMDFFDLVVNGSG